MTTLVGIQAEQGKPGVILGSDISRTEVSWKPEGDVAYRTQRRYEGRKIHVDDAKRLALCMSGIHDQAYVDFLSRILEGEIDVKEVVEKGDFPQLRSLNLMRWNGRVPNNEINGLLIASRFDDKPQLYTCFPLGRVEPRSWTAIGSGSDYALSYISGQGKLIPRRLDLQEGLDLTVGALDSASQDLYTGGLDLVVVTAEEIRSYGEHIKTAVDKARIGVLIGIKTEL